MQLTYIGPFAALTQIGKTPVLIVRGEPAEIDDALATQLLEQAPDHWQAVDTPKPKPKPKRAKPSDEPSVETPADTDKEP